ncbi:MAG TPA: putative Ig domain-containing protein [Terriglobales bacterium]|nr:putative Ig domain-containing protein [Terriglobales bacterium]
MRIEIFTTLKLLSGAAILLASAAMVGQQSAASGPEPLGISNARLPKGAARSPYHFQMQAIGGLPPYTWQVVEGELPAGITLFPDGTLDGSPTMTGDYSITMKVTDGGKPPHEVQKRFTLHVVTALLVEWARPPVVTGQHIEGAVKVINQTERDVDLTVVIVAVNDNGRATALGYQKATVAKDGGEAEVPFGQETNLGYGSYALNVDAVAEVPEIYAIYRARLAPQQKMLIAQQP